MLTGKKAVIFDLDGTLIDSMWVWTRVDVDFLHRYGHTVPIDLHTAIEGMSFSEGARYFKERFCIPLTETEIAEEWNRMAYRLYLEEVSLKKGAYVFVKSLKANGIKTAIATSNSRHLAKEVLRRHGLLQEFDAIITSDEVAKGKPDPQIYLQAAKEVGEQPRHCLVFEDIPMGILAGKRAGMEVCAVRDDFSEHQWQKKAELADYCIDDYEDLKCKV